MAWAVPRHLQQRPEACSGASRGCPLGHPGASSGVFRLSRPPVRPSARPSVRPSAHPPVRPFACPSARPSVCPSVRPSVRPSASPMSPTQLGLRCWNTVFPWRDPGFRMGPSGFPWAPLGAFKEEGAFVCSSLTGGLRVDSVPLWDLGLGPGGCAKTGSSPWPHD